MLKTVIDSKTVKNEDRGMTHAIKTKQAVQSVARNTAGVVKIGAAYFRGFFHGLRS